MRKTHEILARIKRKRGLVPRPGESLDDFQSRVLKTVRYIRSSGFERWLFTGKPRETTDEIRRITKKYLGIQSEPITAYEGQIRSKKYGGMATGELDGSAVIATQDLPDNTNDILARAAGSMESILNDEPVDFDPITSNSIVLFPLAGMEGDNPVDRMYFEMYDGLTRNETCIKLHEGIHAIHFNNSCYGRWSERMNSIFSLLLIPYFIAYACLMFIGRFLPVLGPILKARRFGFSIESEALAYKVSLDEITEDYLTRAGADIPAESLAWFKEQFHERNSRIARVIIVHFYARPWRRGYGTAYNNFLLALLLAMGAAKLVSYDTPWISWAGVAMLVLALSQLVKAPFAAYFERKARDAVAAIDEIKPSFGGAGKAFYAILGTPQSQWRKLAQDTAAASG